VRVGERGKRKRDRERISSRLALSAEPNMGGA